jgi:hypothetical protein
MLCWAWLDCAIVLGFTPKGAPCKKIMKPLSCEVAGVSSGQIHFWSVLQQESGGSRFLPVLPTSQWT